MRWVIANWDFSQLTLSMTKDEEDRVELIGNYALFSKVLSLYLLLYLAANLLWLAAAFRLAPPRSWASLLTSWENWARIFGKVVYLMTPVTGGWQVSTVLVLVVVPLSVALTLRDYSAKLDSMFLDGGFYDVIAGKYHREKGGLARRVWGCVTGEQNELVAGAEVTLTKVPGFRSSAPDGDVTFKAEIRPDGSFHFEREFKEFLTASWKMSVQADTYEPLHKVIRFDKQSVPCVPVKLTKAERQARGGEAQPL